MSSKLKTIPLCQLRRSTSNIRKTDRFADIEQMARSIEANGLLENLVAEPSSSAKGKPAFYEIVAGGRRLAALKLLAKRKKISREHPVPCLVLGNGTTGAEASLAENFIRVPVHPADQFEAFATLSQDGLPAPEIAARFGVNPTFVEQRLKLASVSPRLIAEYRAGAMSLEQLTAFTLCDDHRLQEEVWFERSYADLSAQVIRRLLTKAQVEGSDRRARFIGAAAYESAGGVILRDLFDAEDEGYFTDSQLLDRLVSEKLEAAAQAIREEGWGWVEVHPEADYALLSNYGRVATIEVALTEAEEERLASLGERYDELVTSLEESGGEETEELNRISKEMAALEAKQQSWPEEEKASGGAIVSLGPDGELQVVRGLAKADADSDLPDTALAETRKNARGNGYSESVLRDLAAHRTAALRELVAGKPDVALLALLHGLADRLFYGGQSQNCVSIVPTALPVEDRTETMEGSKAIEAFGARQAEWNARLPDREQLWDWLRSLDKAAQSALLAHCVGLTVNALHNITEEQRTHADKLAAAVDLDMRDWWRPMRANFLGRVTKNEILTAVSEGVSTQASWRLASLKKERMAKEAEKLLADSGWLPASLRRINLEPKPR